MRKLWILVIFVLVAIFGGRVWYLNKNKTDETNVVKIGALLPLSGQLAEQGDLSLKAMLFAADNFNKNSNFKVKIVAEDNKYLAKESISAYRKLRSQGIDLIFVWGSEAPLQAIEPIAREENIPLYVSGWKTLDLGMTFWRYVPLYFSAFSNFVIDNLKSKDVALFYAKDQIQKEITSNIEQHLKEKGINTVIKEEVTVNSCMPLATSLIDKTLNKHPDTVIIQTFGPCLVDLVNTLRERGFKGAIVTPPDIVEQKAALVKSNYPLYFLDSYYDENTSEKEVKDFINKFSEKYGKIPHLTTLETYMATQMIAYSIPDAHYDKMQVLQNMKQIKDFDSILGPINNVKKDNYLVFPWVIKQLQPDGTAKVVKE